MGTRAAARRQIALQPPNQCWPKPSRLARQRRKSGPTSSPRHAGPPKRPAVRRPQNVLIPQLERNPPAVESLRAESGSCARYLAGRPRPSPSSSPCTSGERCSIPPGARLCGKCRGKRPLLQKIRWTQRRRPSAPMRARPLWSPASPRLQILFSKPALSGCRPHLRRMGSVLCPHPVAKIPIALPPARPRPPNSPRPLPLLSSVTSLAQFPHPCLQLP